MSSDTISMSRPSHGCRRFDNKVGIVTAATLGIGLAITTRLCEEGAKVLLCSRKQQNVDATVQQLRALGFDVHGMVCDVAVLANQQALVDNAVQRWGRIDFLVSNAGSNPQAGMSLDMDDRVFDKIFTVNVKSYWQLVKLAQPHFSPNASILFVSSIGAYTPSMPLGLYGVSKTAVVALGKVLAQELGPSGVRVNVIAPGLVRTRFAKMLWDGETGRQQAEQRWLQRLGDPEDMAGTAAFLLSEDASYLTGESITVAGGQFSRL